MRNTYLSMVALLLFIAIFASPIYPQSSDIVLELSISDISWENVGSYVRLKIAGVTAKWNIIYMSDHPGAPLIPAVQALVLLPPNKDISAVSIEKFNVKEIELSAKVLPSPPVFPVKPTEYYSTSKVFYNTSIYSSNVSYPSKDVDYIVFRERGVNFVLIRVYPLKYIPANNTVKLYSSIKVTISLISEKLSYSFYDVNVLNRITRKAVYSYSQASYGSLQPAAISGGIVVVTRAMFVSTLQPLIELRTRQGYSPIKVVTVENIVSSGIEGRDIPEKIRNYLCNLYIDSGGAYRYLLIVGDTLDRSISPPTSLADLELWEVPARYFYNPDDYSTYTPCDWYYATFDSTWDSDGDGIFGENGQDEADWAPEMAVGRIPVRDTATLQEIVDKILNYDSMEVKSSVFTGAILFYYVEEGDSYGYGAQGDTRAEGLIQWLSGLSDLVAESCIIRLYEHYPADVKITNVTQLNGNLSQSNMESVLANNPSLVVWFGHGSYRSAWRKIWSEDSDQDNMVDEDEVLWDTFVTDASFGLVNKPCLILAMSCLTAIYDSDSLGEAALSNTGGWYLGWDRVTYGVLFSDTTWEINPDNWWYADYYVYRFLANLFNGTQTQTYLDPGWAYLNTAIEFVNRHSMNDEADRRVWMAASLIGDPTQKVYMANMFLELLNQTGLTVFVGESFKIVSRIYVGTLTPSPNTPVELQAYENGVWTTLATSYSDGQGFATFNVAFNMPGNYTLRVVYRGNSSTMPYYSDNLTVYVQESAKIVLGYPRVATVNASFPVRVHLYDSSGKPLNNTRVLLYSETLNTLLGNTTTDEEGFARFEVTISQLGVHEFNITYLVDDSVEGGQKFSVEIVNYQVYYIESLPYTVNSSGLYLIVDNLTFPASGKGILINSTDVVMDGQGFYIKLEAFLPKAPSSLAKPLVPDTYFLAVEGESNVTITNLAVEGGNAAGIYVYNSTQVSLLNLYAKDVTTMAVSSSNDTRIVNCSFVETRSGIILWGSFNVTIEDTSMEWAGSAGVNEYGLLLASSSNIHLCNVSLNGRSLDIMGTTLQDYASHTIKASSVNGKPLLYIVNSTSINIGQDVGELIIVNSSSVEASNLEISNVTTGVIIAFSSNVEIRDLVIEASIVGLDLAYSSHVTLRNLNFTSTGIVIRGSIEQHFNSHTITSCRAEGRPIAYIANARDVALGQEYGQVIVASSDNVTVGPLNIRSPRPVVVEIAYSRRIIVKGIYYTYLSAYPAIWITNSQELLISNNTVPSLKVEYTTRLFLAGSTISYCEIESMKNATMMFNTIDTLSIANSSTVIIYLNTFTSMVSCVNCQDTYFYSPAPLNYTYIGEEYTGSLGNHYTWYSGNDTDNNGVIDAPYAGDGFTDKYPLVRSHTYYGVDEPTFMIVEYPETTALPLGINVTGYDIIVHLLYARNATGVPNARIVLYDEGENVLLAENITDVNGYVVFTLQAEEETTKMFNVTFPGKPGLMGCSYEFTIEVVQQTEGITFQVLNIEVVSGKINLHVHVRASSTQVSIYEVTLAVDDPANTVTASFTLSGEGSNDVVANIEYDPSSLSEGEHQLYIVAKAKKETVNYMAWSDPIETYIHQLVKRYNLIALVKPLQINASDLCRIIGEDAVSAVWRWDTDAQEFRSYIPGVSGPEDDFPIKLGYGYFIYLTRPCVLVEVVSP